MPDDLELHRPHGVDAHAWAAITSHRDRLADAMRGSDRSLVLGRAKELAESVARVVITERGQVAPASTDYPALIDSAHAVLKRQPGTDLRYGPFRRSYRSRRCTDRHIHCRS